MLIPVTRHEDNRRILIEYNHEIPFKRNKVMEIKEKSILGNHYHLENDSMFYILRGKARYTLKSIRPNAEETFGWLYEGECLYVPREFIHTFEVWPQTIMLESASEPFNPNDEIQAPK